jgi:hypothetical protein
MRLTELLQRLDGELLEQLADRHLRTGEKLSAAAICVNLESELRSPKHLRDTIYDLQPPAFRLIERLLEADDFSVPVANLRELVIDETAAIAERVTASTILGRNDGLRLYRKVFLEARRNDLQLDPSETAILGVLRRELGIAQVEHFLLEHHEDFWPYWKSDHAFLDVMRRMREAGLVFVDDGNVVFPQDVVAIARQIVGIEVGQAACRRLFDRAKSEDLAESLQAAQLKVSGSKEERINRLVENYVQPTKALAAWTGATLKDVCRDLGLTASGGKDDLIERLVAHFATNGDLRPRTEPPPPPAPEPRVLPPERFALLFATLRGSDLSDVLSGVGSKRSTGAKEKLLEVVRESRFSEETLLLELDNKQLEWALDRVRLKTNGTKTDRARRLIEHFARTPLEQLVPSDTSSSSS